MTDPRPHLDDIRTRLERPDLSDAELTACLGEAAARLGLAASADDLLARPAGDPGLRLALSCMALPQPSHPMAMPEHDLAAEKSGGSAFAFRIRRPAFLPVLLRKR